jgi:hypothetical protein
MKRFRIRYYYEVVQEDVIEARDLDEARDKAEYLVADWDMDTPRPEFVDSPFNDIEVKEID